VQTPGGRSHEGTGIGMFHPAYVCDHPWPSSVPNTQYVLCGSCAGLALVYELVRLHGGTVEVTSQLGAGTRKLSCLCLL
jgi:hypothetical protein